MELADLARDTRVERLPSAPGWFTANLPESWSFRTPSGGVLMAVALRAMRVELDDPALMPTSANTLFCSPVPAGPLEIRVEVLRHGNAAAQMRAALSSTAMPGPGLEVSATFVREREGPDVLDAAMPSVAGPENTPEIEEPFKAPFWRNLEMRLAEGRPWWTPDFEATDVARASRWIRYRVPQRIDDGRIDPFSIPPIVDLMPTALHQKLGPNTRFTAPSLDLTVHFLDHTTSEWLLTSTHARRARAGFASADVEVWDRDGKLIAYATQTMMLRRRPAR